MYVKENEQVLTFTGAITEYTPLWASLVERSNMYDINMLIERIVGVNESIYSSRTK